MPHVLPPIHVLSTKCVYLSLSPFAVDDSANLPPSPPPSPSAEQIGPVAQGTHTLKKSKNKPDRMNDGESGAKQTITSTESSSWSSHVY